MRLVWKSKTDSEHQPVRFLAGLWEQRTGTHLTPKELGQLRDLRKRLGEFTRDVIDWMVEPIHWWRFCQQVRAESGLHSAPPDPHVGFLLKHHGRALRIMRLELHHSTAAADARFCTQLDSMRSEQLKRLLCVLTAGAPEWQARIESAQTLTELRRVFIDFVDENSAASA
jgi:hypothetical protein